MNEFKVGASVECLSGVRGYSCFSEGQCLVVLSRLDPEGMIDCRLDGSEITQWVYPKDLVPITAYEKGDKFIVTTVPNGSCFGMGQVITFMREGTVGKSGYFIRESTGTEQYLYYDKVTPVCTKFHKGDKVIITGHHKHPTQLRFQIGKVFEIRDLTSDLIGGSRGEGSTYVYKAICFDECLPYTEETNKTRHGIDCVITIDTFVYPHRIDGQPSLFDMPKYHIATEVSMVLPLEIGDMVRITDFGVYTGAYESTAKITFVYGDGTIRVDIGFANTGTLVTRSFSKGQYKRFDKTSMWK